MDEKLEVTIEEQIQKFYKFEKLFFKIYLIVVAASFVMFGVVLAFSEHLTEFVDLFLSLTMIAWGYVTVVFFISIVRIVKYFQKIKTIGGLGIWRSVTTFFTSPIMFGLLWLMVFIMALSMASCSV